MKKESFISHRSVTYHLQGNRDYDHHLKALRGIYSRNTRLLTAPQTFDTDFKRRNKENSFKLEHMNRQKAISQENKKLLRNLKDIASRKVARANESEMQKNEMYHDIKFQGKIVEKKRLFERLQQENNKLAVNIKKE